MQRYISNSNDYGYNDLSYTCNIAKILE